MIHFAETNSANLIYLARNISKIFQCEKYVCWWLYLKQYYKCLIVCIFVESTDYFGFLHEKPVSPLYNSYIVSYFLDFLYTIVCLYFSIQCMVSFCMSISSSAVPSHGCIGLVVKIESAYLQFAKNLCRRQIYNSMSTQCFNPNRFFFRVESVAFF